MVFIACWVAIVDEGSRLAFEHPTCTRTPHARPRTPQAMVVLQRKSQMTEAIFIFKDPRADAPEVELEFLCV